jgi:hypothetical protein
MSRANAYVIFFLLKVKVIQNGKWLRWIPKGNHFSTSLEYKLISKLRRNSAFEVFYKCCSFSARHPLYIHNTYKKQNHPTVTLWSWTSYHHSVNTEFNHLPQVLHFLSMHLLKKKLAFTTDLPNTKK